MMNPRCNGVRAFGNALDAVEPFNHVHVPERPVHVHGPAEMPGQVNTELAPVAGFRQAAVKHVMLDVKKLVLYPVRMIKIERQAHEAPPEYRRINEPGLNMLNDVLEADFSARRR